MPSPPPLSWVFQTVGGWVNGAGLHAISVGIVQSGANDARSLTLDENNAVVGVLVTRKGTDTRDHGPEEDGYTALPRSLYLHVYIDTENRVHIVGEIFRKSASDPLLDTFILTKIKPHIRFPGI